MYCKALILAPWFQYLCNKLCTKLQNNVQEGKQFFEFVKLLFFYIGRYKEVLKSLQLQGFSVLKQGYKGQAYSRISINNESAYLMR
jgi:hypothetical protein